MIKGLRKDTKVTNSPDVLCCYSAEWRSKILMLTANNLFQLQGQNLYTATIWRNGQYIQLMSVWMVQMYLILISIRKFSISDPGIRPLLSTNSERWKWNVSDHPTDERKSGYTSVTLPTSPPINWHHLTNLKPRSELHLMQLYIKILVNLWNHRPSWH